MPATAHSPCAKFQGNYNNLNIMNFEILIQFDFGTIYFGQKSMIEGSILQDGNSSFKGKIIFFDFNKSFHNQLFKISYKFR